MADVVITGVTTDPLTRSVALDLERRGFVVFCAVPPACDTLIEQEGKPDLRALPLDIAEVGSYICLKLILGECRCVLDGSVCAWTEIASSWSNPQFLRAIS